MQFPPGAGQVQALATIANLPQAPQGVKNRAQNAELMQMTPAMIAADPYDALALARFRPQVVAPALDALAAAAVALDAAYSQGMDGARAGICEGLLPENSRIPQAFAAAAGSNWPAAVAAARRLPGIVKADSLARVAAAKP